MAHEDHGAFDEYLASRGVSRRDFLKYCGSVAALLGLSQTFVPQIAAAIQQGAKQYMAEGEVTHSSHWLANAKD